MFSFFKKHQTNFTINEFPANSIFSQKNLNFHKKLNLQNAVYSESCLGGCSSPDFNRVCEEIVRELESLNVSLLTPTRHSPPKLITTENAQGCHKPTCRNPRTQLPAGPLGAKTRGRSYLATPQRRGLPLPRSQQR